MLLVTMASTVVAAATAEDEALFAVVVVDKGSVGHRIVIIQVFM